MNRQAKEDPWLTAEADFRTQLAMVREFHGSVLKSYAEEGPGYRALTAGPSSSYLFFRSPITSF